MKKADYDPLAFGTVDLSKSGANSKFTSSSEGSSAPEDMLFEAEAEPATDTFQAAGPQFAEAPDLADMRSAYGDDDVPAGFDEGAGGENDVLSMTAITPQAEALETRVFESELEFSEPQEPEQGQAGVFEVSTHPMGGPASPPVAAEIPEMESEPESMPSGASLYQSMSKGEPELAEPLSAESETVPPWVQKRRAAPRAAPRVRPNSEASRVDILQLPRERRARGGVVAFGLPLMIFGAGAAGGAWIGLMHQNPIMGGVAFVLGCVGSMFCRVLLR